MANRRSASACSSPSPFPAPHLRPLHRPLCGGSTKISQVLLAMCGTPRSGGVYITPHAATQPHILFFGDFRDFRSKKAKKNQPKKWPKNGQKWSKLPQNRRNNWRASPRKSQQILKISQKWPKTPPVQSENAPKRVKMAKNDQKSAKMAKKWQTLYKKLIFSTTASLKRSFP